MDLWKTFSYSLTNGDWFSFLSRVHATPSNGCRV